MRSGYHSTRWVATNLLAADVGGGRGGFELRHDGFRDVLLRELRAAGFSVEKEFEIGVEHGLAEAHAAVLRGSLAVATLDAYAHTPEAELSDMELRAKADAQREVQEALRHGATEAELRAHGGSAKGMRIDLGVMRAEGTSERRVFECKSMALCKTRYGTREHKSGYRRGMCPRASDVLLMQQHEAVRALAARATDVRLTQLQLPV